VPASPRSTGFSSEVGGDAGTLGYDGIVYALLLRVPLTIAQSSTAGQFVRVNIAASLVLDEPISPARWLGIAARICVGVFLAGFNANV